MVMVEKGGREEGRVRGGAKKVNSASVGLITFPILYVGRS
jgi:hypothetical protein